MELMETARARMMLKYCFFATLLMLTRMFADTSIPTACTDMVSIWFNPEFLTSLGTMDLVIFVLAHEMCHIMLKHELRRCGRNMEIWNIACDHEINLFLKAAGFAIWDKAYCDERFTDMSAEVIYDILVQENEEDKKRGKTPRHGMGDGDGGTGRDMKEMPPLDAEAKAVIERAVAGNVARAAAMARAAGNMPAALERFIDGILDPVVPWQDYFRDYMQRVVHDEESWARRNRRISQFYMPARYSQRMGEVVVIGDTSCSRGTKELAKDAAEIVAMADLVKPERIRVLWCDTVVDSEQVFEQGDLIECKPTGGGGTDMVEGLRYAEQYDPVVVVLITDGFTPWPSSVPFPLIVCCTTDTSVPIGEVIRL